ncbi:MAG: Na+/H+ antiporter NhaC family protein [Traorella sp.]
MNGSFWALLPPIVVIIMALITKEVYSSLFIGILVGCILFTGFHPLVALKTCFSIMGNAIGENASLLVFLVLLGIIVILVTKSGASKAYGNAASKIIKSRRSALLATSALGFLIFIDDYFNCLTVGTVMSPLTDKFHVTRAKLAYIIDATAAPVCILVPVSSWAAAIAASLPKESTLNGFNLFLSTIPYNLYAWFTLVFVFWIIWIDKDFFTMKKYHEKIDLAAEKVIQNQVEEVGHGKVIDLLLPIIVLVLTCIGCMLYSGHFFEGVSFYESISTCDSTGSLVLGAVVTLLFIFALYIPRKVVTYNQFCDSIVEGFKIMTPPIILLCLSWTLSGICASEYLNLGGFISSLIADKIMIYRFMPAIFFITSFLITFATGASWGAFGMLIPIIAILIPNESVMLSLSVAACLAGAVAGDHCSPLADTTILSSAGSQVNHLDHVATQLPYSLVVIVVSLIGYFIGGWFESGIIALISSGLVLLIGMSVVTIKIKKNN